MSRCNSPRAKIRTAGMRTPSSKYVRAIEFSDPGVTPPTSVQCAVDSRKATRSPR